jgi:hypothetical protein
MTPLLGGWVVVLYRMDDDYSQVLIGPFRSEERAKQRADVIRAAAAKYEDPEGALGDDNILGVEVEPVIRGRVSADDALAVLYESISIATPQR